MKYYSLKRILTYNARYNVIFGERSNGKTFAVYEKAISDYYATGAQFGIIRRWQDDYTGKRGQTMFNAIVEKGIVKKITHGEWTGVHYRSSQWFLSRKEGDNLIISDDPFAYGFAITAQEHDKSTAYPRIKNILFDEFITRSVYAPDEFVLFTNVLSTIIRERTDVIIFMCGNTVNKYCPYFSEMGLKHAMSMQQGTIDLYRYGNSELTVAVEYTAPTKQGKPSDVYFAFDNPKLKMITEGAWEIDIYPHCPEKYRPCDVIFKYFIIFNGETLQANIIHTPDGYFTFIHRKTTPIKGDNELIFDNEVFSPRPNIRRNILKPQDLCGQKIAELFGQERIFYSDNEIGEIVNNYLKTCRTR